MTPEKWQRYFEYQAVAGKVVTIYRDQGEGNRAQIRIRGGRAS